MEFLSRRVGDGEPLEVTQVVVAQATCKDQNALLSTDAIELSAWSSRAKEISDEPQFSNGCAQNPLFFRLQTTINANFDNGYIGERVAEHVDERHVHSMVESRSIVTTSVSTTYFSDWRGTRRHTVLSDVR